MRQVKLKISASLDGFVGGPNGELDWMFQSMDAEASAWTVDSIRNAGVHIMGRKTFLGMVDHWPSSDEPFAAPMNEIPKVYFSKAQSAMSEATIREHLEAGAKGKIIPDEVVESWTSARAVTDDLVGEIARLKAEPGADILAHGGASFVQSLAKLGLIDEYRLLIHPVALGAGLPLFADLAEPLQLDLVEVTPFPGGAVAHVFRARNQH
jgi:dihydrofolate reductase